MARSPITATTGQSVKIGNHIIYVGRIRVRANGKREVHLAFKGPSKPVKLLTQPRK